jgi:hypothetical protein
VLVVSAREADQSVRVTSRARRARKWILAPFLFGFFGSTCTHGAVVAAMLFGASGRASGGAEAGHSGAGDTSVDVTLAGASEKKEEAKKEPPKEDAPKKESTPSKPLPPVPPPQPDAIEPEPPPPLPSPEAMLTPPPGNADETNGGRTPGPARLGAPNLPPSGDTIEGQRALLPAATTCSDPVAGRWEALKYTPLRGDWVRFTLTVRRASDGALDGTILSHTWSGTLFDRTPPGCTFGGFDLTVTMNAHGRADSSGRITFGASRYSVIANRCVSLEDVYAPDNFSGTVDAARQEFQSLNNDGANDVNAPYVFRRTGCI